MDRTIGAARKVFAQVAAPEQRRGGQPPVLASGAIVAAVALAALANPRGSVSIALAGGVGSGMSVAAVAYTTLVEISVITALLLKEMLSANVFMPVEFSTATPLRSQLQLFSNATRSSGGQHSVSLSQIGLAMSQHICPRRHGVCATLRLWR